MSIMHRLFGRSPQPEPPAPEPLTLDDRLPLRPQDQLVAWREAAALGFVRRGPDGRFLRKNQQGGWVE